ncbi:unnamed protein product [Periconia digitata]|uniref:Uncharacterized protein n=1 Tax=Periconia digitata TaxID=1303443 RepID=A0A9W4UFG0_9PLEO|nr:unnamed protein product [Periconia digitata]
MRQCWLQKVTYELLRKRHLLELHLVDATLDAGSGGGRREENSRLHDDGFGGTGLVLMICKTKNEK